MKVKLLLLPIISSQTLGQQTCDDDILPYQRRTLYPHLYESDCGTQAKTLTIFMGQRKCSTKWINWHKLRGTWCDKSADGSVADPTGIGTANCMFELKRDGKNRIGSKLSDTELLIFCRTYMKLKCDRALH